MISTQSRQCLGLYSFCGPSSEGQYLPGALGDNRCHSLNHVHKDKRDDDGAHAQGQPAVYHNVSRYTKTSHKINARPLAGMYMEISRSADAPRNICRPVIAHAGGGVIYAIQARLGAEALRATPILSTSRPALARLWLLMFATSLLTVRVHSGTYT